MGFSFFITCSLKWFIPLAGNSLHAHFLTCHVYLVMFPRLLWFDAHPPQHKHTPVSSKQMQTADGTDEGTGVVVITVLCVRVVLRCARGDSLGITCQLERKRARSRVEVSKVSGGEESVCVCVCNIFYCEATVSQQ